MRVFIPSESFSPILHNTRMHEVPFLYLNENFEIVRNTADADIIPVLSPPVIDNNGVCHDTESKIRYINANLENKWILILLFSHAVDSEDQQWYQEHIDKWKPYTDKILLMGPNKTLNEYGLIYHDFYFNLAKSYYCDFDKYADWLDRYNNVGNTKKSYELDNIQFLSIEKKFTIPNSVRKEWESDIILPMRKITRFRLADFIKNDDCFYSDWRINKTLDSQEYSEDLESLRQNAIEHGMPGVPINNKYHQTSAVTAYGETCVSGNYNVRVISEKTFNPLVKGSFIVPMSYPGMIDDLKTEYNFKFPDWIDYSYDSIQDDSKRLEAYISSLNKIREKSNDELLELCRKDIPILEHNRNVFFTRPYDSLSEKIKQKIKV